ncbi:MAG: hypothetical protein ACYCSI_15090 [Solirubrobacteraceae bacterium]
MKASIVQQHRALMRVLLALAATAVAGAAFSGAAQAALPSPGVTPNLCEHECGGSWGAYEHAKADVENHRRSSGSQRNIKVTGCYETNPGAKRGETQWICYGEWEEMGPIGSPWIRFTFEVGLGPYGSQTSWRAEEH